MLIFLHRPGTGKTATIVEAVNQIVKQYPHSKILVSAPSNSAADTLAQCLRPTLSTKDMLRYNGNFRDPGSLPSDLAPYSLRNGNMFTPPALGMLMRYKVVVSTCHNASFAYNIGIPERHWTHVFVDEAGKASEPEIMCAINSGMALDNTRIILSGDPKQLGPIVRSSAARQCGMEQGYLQRLIQRPLYSDESGRGRS